MPSTIEPVLCCHLQYRVAPVLFPTVPGRLSTAWLGSLVAFSCHILYIILWYPSGDTRGPSVVFKEVDVTCPGPFNCSNIFDYSYDFCPLTNPFGGLSIIVCDVEHTSFHFGLCGRKWFGACLVSVQVSAPHVIAGSTQELCTCRL